MNDVRFAPFPGRLGDDQDEDIVLEASLFAPSAFSPEFGADGVGERTSADMQERRCWVPPARRASADELERLSFDALPFTSDDDLESLMSKLSPSEVRRSRQARLDHAMQRWKFEDDDSPSQLNSAGLGKADDLSFDAVGPAFLRRVPPSEPTKCDKKPTRSERTRRWSDLRWLTSARNKVKVSPLELAEAPVRIADDPCFDTMSVTSDDELEMLESLPQSELRTTREARRARAAARPLGAGSAPGSPPSGCALSRSPGGAGEPSGEDVLGVEAPSSSLRRPLMNVAARALLLRSRAAGAR